MKKTTLSLAISGALGLSAFIATPVQLHAQQGAEMLEEVIVTGSRIRRTDLSGYNPVSVISRTDIDNQSFVSIGDILQRSPFSAGQATNTAVNNGGSGAVNFSLRGLGSTRTLVLVNGRRVVASGLGANATVDLNNIPSGMIERIEILKDGASSVYGSDAVAGVVNVITRKDYEGAEFNVASGATSENDGDQTTADFTFGTSTERANFVFSGYWTEQKPIWAGDRDYSQEEIWYHPYWDPTGQATGGSSAVPWGNHGGTDGKRYTRGAEFGSWRPYSGSSDPYNYAPANYAQTPNERWGLSSFGSYNLGDVGALKNIELGGEIMFTHRRSQRLIAPEPLAPLAFFGSPAPYSPLNHYNITQGPKNAAGETMVLNDWRRRMVETGGRDQLHETNTHQVVLSLSGEVGSWFWDASASYGENDASVTDLGYFQLERVADAVGPTFTDSTGNILCSSDGTAAGVIDGCVPLNVFGQPGTDSQVTPEMLQYISGNYVSMTLGGNDTKIAQFNLSGPLFELPAGELGAAFGVEKRWVTGFSQPDSLQLLGVSTAGSSLATAGGYDVQEAYAEFAIPIFENLEASLATRYSDYNTFGDTTNSKLGLRWTVNDELTLRGTVSEAFRAPSIPELYAGIASTFPTVVDPCADNPTPFCVADGVPAGGYDDAGMIQLPSKVGGNVNLQPEEAEILTLGAVYEPEWIQGLSLTLDYWDIDVKGAISTTGPQLILDNCQQTGRDCDKIDRWAPGSGAEVGGIVFINDLNTNVGGVQSSGVDLSARYQMEPTNFGLFSFGYDLAYLTKYEKELANGSTLDHTGRFEDNQDGNFPEVRWNFNTNWSMGNWDAVYAVRYVGQTEELLNKWYNATDVAGNFTEERTIDEQVIHNLQMSYNFEQFRTRFTLGVDNVTDEQPPFAYSGFNDNTDPRTYETRGRYYYGRMSVSF